MNEIPNVTYLSKERIENPDWKPPFDAGVVTTNFAFRWHRHLSEWGTRPL